MKTTIIECNPSSNSFSESIKEKIMNTLKDSKKEFNLIDLYKDNFNPVMTEEDEKLYSKGESLDELVKKYQGYIKESNEIILDRKSVV